MSQTKVTGYHVRHDLRPDFTFELLTLLNALPDGQDEEALQSAAEQQGYSLRQRKDYGKMLRSLDELELIERSRKALNLTERGRIISEVMLYQKDLLGELVHIAYYTGYSHDPTKRFSWSYQTMCNWLWDSAPCEIHRDRLVNVVSQAAQDEFDEKGISFSTQSVSGILHWVTALNPPCVDSTGNFFNRRSYCPVESFMVALHDTYELAKDDTLSIPISAAIRERVCRICLIMPESFSEMLELAERTFSGLQVWRKRGERFAITDFSWHTLTE
jgi:hypothetical protein